MLRKCQKKPEVNINGFQAETSSQAALGYSTNVPQLKDLFIATSSKYFLTRNFFKK